MTVELELGALAVAAVDFLIIWGLVLLAFVLTGVCSIFGELVAESRQWWAWLIVLSGAVSGLLIVLLQIGIRAWNFV